MVKTAQALRPALRSICVRRGGSPVYSGAARNMLALQGISGPTGGFNAARRHVGIYGPVTTNLVATRIPSPATAFESSVVDALPGPNAWSPPV